MAILGGLHLGAQHGWPQGDEGADDGQTDESEQVEGLVGDEQTGSPRLYRGEGHDRTEGRSQGQQAGGRAVEPHRGVETAGEGVANLMAQVKGVPGEHRADDHRSYDRHPRPVRHHADTGDDDACRQQTDAQDLTTAISLGEVVVQDRLGEVLAPHHDRGRCDA